MEDRKQDNIRHTLSHILAMAVLKESPTAKLGIGPTIENGFYYDFDFTNTQRITPNGSRISGEDSGEKRRITEKDLPKIEEEMKRLLKKDLQVVGKKVSAEEARAFFREKNQPYKIELIDEFEKEGKEITLYTISGGETSFTDLCKGGHVESVADIDTEAFKLDRIAGAYWRGRETNPMLTRIYGLAFESKEKLEKYLQNQKEIGRRDHRELGERLELFKFEDIAPGSAFWLPKGMIIWKELEKFMRQELEQAGYHEISTPILVKKNLWIESGHWDHYRENMFLFQVDDETYSLKPMNCPESTYVYRAKLRSWRDLPLRYSEITGRLHRNELSGTLGGLFRVRQLIQDDAHIYCRPDQILDEIASLLKLAKKIYKVFGFKIEYQLATKPDKAMGDPKLWEKAEQALEEALKKNKIAHTIKPKDGAFYGPKIDVHAKDALDRSWQLSTIQLDFQMPERFNLTYANEKGEKVRPVMIHRALLGSFERFIGVLLEHTDGDLPLWLSPVQAAIIPVGSGHRAYAKTIADGLSQEGFKIQLMAENETVGKKIRNAEIMKIPYMIVVGDEEKKKKKIRVRSRKAEKDLGLMDLKKFAKKLQKEINDKN